MSKQNSATETSCDFCSNPQLWEVDFSYCVEERHSGIAARGHFLKRMHNPHYPAWPVQCIFRETDQLRSKLLLGRDHFAPKWQRFNVEILGFAFTVLPPMPPSPLFGMDHIYSPGSEDKYTLWTACKITSEEFDFVVKLHWWPSHERTFGVDRFNFEGAAEIAALKDALSIFSPGRGRKPSEYFTSNKEFLRHLKAAVMNSHGNGRIPSQIEIAEELFHEAEDSARELRRWLKTSWRKWRWKDIVQAIVEDDMADRVALSKQSKNSGIEHPVQW